ncbi:MAG: GNAT family N-acetyltransferase [Longimicrobiales bacterium]
MQIRAYRAPHDFAAVRRCQMALQDFERSLDPRLPSGEDIVDAYLALLLDRCARFAGALFVAELDGRVTGFVSVLGAYRSDDITNDPTTHAYVDDLVVLDEYRSRGFGRALLQHAEAYAIACGRSSIRLRVKSGNRHALEFYNRGGYRDFEHELEKRL